MSKKFIHYSGFIALESLMTIALLYFIVINYISFSNFLLQKREDQNQKLECYRILYEQVKLARTNRDFSSRVIEQNGKNYTIEFTEKNHTIVKAVIFNGDQIYEIEK